MYKNLRRKFFILLSASLVFSLTTPTFAEPGCDEDDCGSANVVKAKPEYKLTYKVENSKVTSNHKVMDSSQWKGLMQHYPTQQFLDRIKGLPGIDNVQFTPGQHTIDGAYFDKDVVRSLRTSSLMVRIQGSAPFSMLFKVDEELHRCKSMVSNPMETENLDKWGEPDWSDSSVDVNHACKMETAMVIKGPIAVYGTIPGNLANRTLLMNQIEFKWELKSSFDKEDTEINSSFNVTRADFPEAVRKILNWTVGTNVPFSEMFFENPQRNALVQVGRVLREKNQEILKGQ